MHVSTISLSKGLLCRVPRALEVAKVPGSKKTPIRFLINLLAVDAHE